MATLELIGTSAKFRALLNDIDVVAPVDSAVLIQSEYGARDGVLDGGVSGIDTSPRSHGVAAGETRSTLRRSIDLDSPAGSEFIAPIHEVERTSRTPPGVRLAGL
jgi:hypothetical protein